MIRCKRSVRIAGKHVEFQHTKTWNERTGRYEADDCPANIDNADLFIFNHDSTPVSPFVMRLTDALKPNQIRVA